MASDSVRSERWEQFHCFLVWSEPVLVTRTPDKEDKERTRGIKVDMQMSVCDW